VRQEAELHLSQFLRPSTLKEDYRASPDSCRSLKKHPLGLKLSDDILDSFETINSNISTFENNSEANFHTLVKKMDASITAVKIVDERVFHSLKKMNQPLPIELTANISNILTTILKDVDFIKENMRDQKDLEKDILITLKSLQESQKTSTDFILASLKQDAIIKRAEIIKSIKEIKEIVLKNEHEYKCKNDLLLEKNESMKADLEHLKEKKENTHHNYGRTEDTKTRECGPSLSFYQDTRENPPHISHKAPLYNNPYMQEEIKKNNSADPKRDSTPYCTMDMSAINKLMPPIKDY
ncbi:hypothetical protein VP01_6066g1, partial [Puccinia sorghi]